MATTDQILSAKRWNQAVQNAVESALGAQLGESFLPPTILPDFPI